MHAYLIAIIMGIVEGLTEFLPVSSTGHLILAGDLLHFTGAEAKSFEIFIQLGAILAIVVLYRRKLWEMAFHWKPDGNRPGTITPWHIAVAMVPAVVFGFVLYHPIKNYLFSPLTVLIGLVVGGIYILFAEKFERPVIAGKLDNITFPQALCIGLFQCLALWPGFSRSGATIAGALLIGVGLRAAADFSFILAVPMMIGATGLDLYESANVLNRNDTAIFAVGFVVSFLVAWLTVAMFLKVLEKVRLSPFAWYRFGLASLFGLYIYPWH